MNNARRGNTAGVFIYILRKGLLPWGRSCPRSGLMWGECALTARYRVVVARSALIRLRAGPQTPSPEGEGGAERRMRGELTDTARERVALPGSALISHLR